MIAEVGDQFETFGEGPIESFALRFQFWEYTFYLGINRLDENALSMIQDSFYFHTRKQCRFLHSPIHSMDPIIDLKIVDETGGAIQHFAFDFGYPQGKRGGAERDYKLFSTTQLVNPAVPESVEPLVVPPFPEQWRFTDLSQGYPQRGIG